MKTTKSESENKKERPVEAPAVKIHSSAFGVTSEAETSTRSESLSKDLATSLMGLIRDVNKDGVTPDTVNASCNAAAQIHKILRLNFEMKKEGF